MIESIKVWHRKLDILVASIIWQDGQITTTNVNGYQIVINPTSVYVQEHKDNLYDGRLIAAVTLTNGTATGITVNADDYEALAVSTDGVLECHKHDFTVETHTKESWTRTDHP